MMPIGLDDIANKLGLSCFAGRESRTPTDFALHFLPDAYNSERCDKHTWLSAGGMGKFTTGNLQISHTKNGENKTRGYAKLTKSLLSNLSSKDKKFTDLNGKDHFYYESMRTKIDELATDRRKPLTAESAVWELIDTLSNDEEVYQEIATAISKKKDENQFTDALFLLVLTAIFSLPKDIQKLSYLWKDVSQNKVITDKKDQKKIIEFRKTTASPAYKEFVRQVMEQYYGADFFTTVNERTFATYTIEGEPFRANRYITDIDRHLCDKDNSDLSFNLNNHKGYTKYPLYKEYNALVGANIHHPHRPGYMLDELILTDGKVSSFRAHVGAYAENIYSNHVLEYELYRAYLEFGHQNIRQLEVWEKLYQSLEIRNSFHKDVNRNDKANFHAQMAESLCKGTGRQSLISVQMLVLIKDGRDQQYKLQIIERSNDVAIQSNIYQCIPAGGLDVMRESEDGSYLPGTLKSNFSVGCAVFREFLEELFNCKEYEAPTEGSLSETLLADKRIKQIEKLIRDGKAIFQFLGSTTNLAGLRQELSFLFIVDDEDAYWGAPFKVNGECKKGGFLEGITIDNFESQKEIWNNLHGPSAAMWYLFKKTDLYQERISR